MKSDEEIMEILEGFDLTRSFRGAGELAGCSPNTVAHWVGARDAGTLHSPARREQLIDPFLNKVEEWVEASKAKVRADIAHDKLVGPGLWRLRAHHPQGGGRGQEGLSGRAAAHLPAVGARAGDVVPVRLRTGPGGGREADAAVLRLAVVVAVPGGEAGASSKSA